VKTAVLTLAIFLGLAVLITSVRGLSRADARSSSKPVDDLKIDPGPLGEDDFWALIDHSAAFEADTVAQAEDLRASLLKLTPEQIADFERLFHQKMQDSYSWDLWGAAYVANGGASDDGFEYFRCWLISKGRRVFEMVLADPDSLADMLAPNAGGDLEFEEFAYVAREAWTAKTGRDWNDMPVVAEMAYDGQPKGTPFSDEAAALARRYPKLWKRFGG
jgi:hypothetical protein